MYRYKITLECATDASGETRGGAADKLQFLAEDHDDIFEIVRRQRAEGLWDDDTALSSPSASSCSAKSCCTIARTRCLRPCSPQSPSSSAA